MLLASTLFVAKLSFSQPNSNVSSAVTAKILRPLLNSERIKLKFGSYGIDVLQNKRKIRVSNLYSKKDNIKTTRTFAVVVYPEVVAPEFKRVHQQIVGGGSIGATFKKSGWKITKQHSYFGKIDSSTKFTQLYQLMGGIKPSDLAVHLYQLNVSKGGKELHYATIAEVHHPDYLTSTELQAIYKEQYEDLQKTNSDINSVLNIVKEKLVNL